MPKANITSLFLGGGRSILLTYYIFYSYFIQKTKVYQTVFTLYFTIFSSTVTNLRSSS